VGTWIPRLGTEPKRRGSARVVEEGVSFKKEGFWLRGLWERKGTPGKVYMGWVDGSGMDMGKTRKKGTKEEKGGPLILTYLATPGTDQGEKRNREQLEKKILKPEGTQGEGGEAIL